MAAAKREDEKEERYSRRRYTRQGRSKKIHGQGKEK
jgi:hypothetical protein